MSKFYPDLKAEKDNLNLVDDYLLEKCFENSLGEVQELLLLLLLLKIRKYNFAPGENKNTISSVKAKILRRTSLTLGQT